MAEAILNPTPDQTFRIEGRGDYDFSRTLRLSDEAQRRGAVDEACNLRFHAFQHLADLIPDNEEVILEWEHPNTQAALHLLYRSAVDHFLIDDFELSAAMLEFLLDLEHRARTGFRGRQIPHGNFRQMLIRTCAALRPPLHYT